MKTMAKPGNRGDELQLFVKGGGAKAPDFRRLRELKFVSKAILRIEDHAEGQNTRMEARGRRSGSRPLCREIS